MLGFSLPSALLLGAALSPTDPVLAADVQVGTPMEGAADDVRFGIGSFYYLSFASKEAHFSHGNELWSITAFIALLSVLVHGLTATKVMGQLEKYFDNQAAKEMKA